jgi:hypothetical protein
MVETNTATRAISKRQAFTAFSEQNFLANPYTAQCFHLAGDINGCVSGSVIAFF